MLAIIYAAILQDQPIMWTLNSDTCTEHEKLHIRRPRPDTADNIQLKTIKRLMT